MDTTAQRSESVPDTKPSDASRSQTNDKGEKSPGLGTGTQEQQDASSSTELTDQQKADRKRKNDERRERRWYEERGAMRAEMQQLKDQLQEVVQQNSRTREHPAEPQPGEPNFEQYLNSGKYKTFESAQQAWMRDSMTFLRQQMRQEGSQVSAVQQQEQDQRAFQKQLADGRKQFGEGFNDALDAVEDAFDGPQGEPTRQSTYLVKAKDAKDLILHLGTHPELLEELQTLDYEDFIAEIGAIRKELKAGKTEASHHPTDKPKPPGQVGGRSNAPDPLTAMRQATEANDFTAFRQASRAREKTTA